MQPSDARFSLRFESGDRVGETLPLEPGVLTLGRRPGNQVVLSHSSVSGKHAELRVDASGAELVDLDSTNGTRVGAERVTKVRLAHGDRVSIGQVELTFQDARFQAAARTPAPSAGAANAGEDVGAVSAEQLAAARKKGGLGTLLLLGGLLAVGGGAGWYLTKGAGAPGGGAAEVVEDVPGNLFAYGTFEAQETPAWETSEASTGVVELDRGFAATGRVGLGAGLAEGEWFLARSEPFEARARSAYSLSAAVSVEGGRARLGVELAGPDGPPLVVWSPALTGADFADVRLAFPGIVGHETARLVFAGQGPGVHALDDVVVLADDPPAAVTFGDHRCETFGGATSTAIVTRAGTPLVPAVQLDPWTQKGFEAGAVPEAGRLTAAASENGFTFDVPSGTHSVLVRYAPETLDRVATVGADGYRSHVGAFEAKGVEAVLIGWGADLAQLAFPRAVDVAAERAGDGLTVRIDASGLASFDLRFDFQAERAEARGLASRADEADRAGRVGEAIALWDELLETYPFEKPLIEAAEAGRARRVGEGFAALEGLREEFERARFFELDDLFRECAEDASEVAASFGGTEVEAAADALVAKIEEARAGLATGGADEGADRLRRILGSAAAEAAPSWAAHLSNEGNTTDG